MRFKIEKMTAEDKTNVMDMMQVFYSSNAVISNGSSEIFENDVEACVGSSPFAEGYVFKMDKTYMGYAMIAKSYSTEFGKMCIWVEDLYITSEYRGMGIGAAFFEYLFSNYGADVVYRLEVEAENLAAISLYKKCGFEIIPYSEMIKIDG